MAIAKKAPAKKVATKKAPAKKAAIKKAVTKKTVPKKATSAVQPAWNTIHIFGYGESQIIGRKANGKVPNGELKALASLFSSLAKKQQKGTKINIDDTHALNIFNGSFVDYRPRGMNNNGQRFAWADVDAKAIDKLAEELISKAPKEKTDGGFMARFMVNRKSVAAKKATVKKSVSKAK